MNHKRKTEWMIREKKEGNYKRKKESKQVLQEKERLLSERKKWKVTEWRKNRGEWMRGERKNE